MKKTMAALLAGVLLCACAKQEGDRTMKPHNDFTPAAGDRVI
jgi:hypothetical protein